jgi:hypothetical protein
MSTIKDKILDIVKRFNPKSISKVTMRNKEIKEYVEQFMSVNNLDQISEALFCIINDIEPLKCDCGKTRSFNTFVKGYHRFCSRSCEYSKNHLSNTIKHRWSNDEAKQKMRQNYIKTMIETYGVENPMFSKQFVDKMKTTNLERYGAETPFQSEEIQQKIKQICLSKYGVEKPFQSSEIRDKGINTFKSNHSECSDVMEIARAAAYEKFNGNPFADEGVKAKCKQTMLEKTGRKHARQSHLSLYIVDILEDANKFSNEIFGLSISEAGVKLGVDPTTIIRRAMSYKCIKSLVKTTRSKWEFKLKLFLLSLGLVEGVDFIRSDRKILNKKELDFYFPNLNKAIEVGSLFYHSELRAKRKPNYHYDKWKRCNQQNIELLQYWDCEMRESWDVIESKIKYMLGLLPSIGARKITKIVKIPLSIEQVFLDQNHIQGCSRSRKASFGAYINDELVGVMSINISNKEMNIVRYATETSHVYVGLFSKMMKYVISQYQNVDRVISFSDNRHGSGNLYEKNNFKIVHHVPHDFVFTRNYHYIEHNSLYRKDKIKSKFDIETSGKSRWEIMKELKYDRIWDAGKIKWVLNLK